MNDSFETPILLLIFNRPLETAKVWERLREIKPSHLYVAADGPRFQNPLDEQTCAATRKIVTEGIDWDCKPHFLFRESNLGCGQAIQSAISWFFQQVPAGIILEDDCLPHYDFFAFCERLLGRYQNQDEVFLISGSAVPGDFQVGLEADYLFTYIPSIWGWATWKRSWAKYDFRLTALDEYERSGDIEKIFPKHAHQKYWLNYFHEIRDRHINNWDYQLAFASFRNKGLCVRPRVNLVQNLGMTITNGKNKMIERSHPLTITKHPDSVKPNVTADLAIMKALTAPLHRLKFFLKKVGLFYILKKIYKKL